MAAFRVNHIVHEPDVVPAPFKAYSLRHQRICRLLEIVSVFLYGGVFQNVLYIRADFGHCRCRTVGKGYLIAGNYDAEFGGVPVYKFMKGYLFNLRDRRFLRCAFGFG